MPAAVQILKALADESRLRILFVVKSEPLSVNEILEVLEMGQSRVSRHLRILAEAGVLNFERQGSRIYYGIDPKSERMVQGLLHSLGLVNVGGDPQQGRLPPEIERDQFQLRLFLERRKKAGVEHFQNYGADQDRLMAGLVDVDYYRQEILSRLPALPGVVADLGCGGGGLAELLVERSEKLIGVDQSPRMLREAGRRIPRADFRLGRLEHLPLRDGEANTVVLAMALHHMPDPRLGLREARRVLADGGTLVLAELHRHEEETMRTKFGDFWLGFEPARLQELLESAGFSVAANDLGRGQGQLESILLVARKKAGREVFGQTARPALSHSGR